MNLAPIFYLFMFPTNKTSSAKRRSWYVHVTVLSEFLGPSWHHISKQSWKAMAI